MRPDDVQVGPPQELGVVRAGCGFDLFLAPPRGDFVIDCRREMGHRIGRRRILGRQAAIAEPKRRSHPPAAGRKTGRQLDVRTGTPWTSILCAGSDMDSANLDVRSRQICLPIPGSADLALNGNQLAAYVNCTRVRTCGAICDRRPNANAGHVRPWMYSFITWIVCSWLYAL